MKQPEHSLFSFSATQRWAACPGSMAYPENTAEGVDAGPYADEGTAAHELAAYCLKHSFRRCENFIGQKIKVGKREFEITEEFAGHVQTYVDDVERRALGGFLLVEQRVSLAGIEGFDESNYGTSDAIIGVACNGNAPAYGVVCDLKFGMGEKVHAWERASVSAPFTLLPVYAEETGIRVVPNYQLMMYALASLRDLELLVDAVSGVQIVINQPRLGHLSELWAPLADLKRFAVFAADALKVATNAMGFSPTDPKLENWLNPGEKQCRWCRAMARCPALAKYVQKQVRADFDVIAAEPPKVPEDSKPVAKALLAVPLITDWCRAVMAKANELVSAGVPVIGPDDKPYKFIEGRQGDRKWKDPQVAETVLVGVLGPKAYKPQEILSAAGAAKVLDKKSTAEMWKDMFVPLIKRAPGKPLLVLGSDPRPAFSPPADADEFDVEVDWSIPE